MHCLRDLHPLRDNLLGFHAFTACDTTSAFTGHGKWSCWKTFRNHPHLVQGNGRDGELALIEQFVYHLYAHLSSQPSTTPDSNSSVRASLEMLPQTRDALELHTARANYQVKLWLHADQEHIHIPSPTDTSAWTMESDCLKTV